MSIFSLRWKPLATIAAIVTVSAAGMMAGHDASPAFAAKTVQVYAGAGQAGIAVNLFLPDSVVVNLGDTVEFTNPYEEPHTVTYVVGDDEIENDNIDTCKLDVGQCQLYPPGHELLVETVDKRLFGLVGLFTTVNIFIAVLWT